MPYIDLLPLILIGASPVALGLAGLAGLRVSALRRQLTRLTRARNLAVATADATERQLRLFAGELRETALSLRGHADLLTARDTDPPVDAHIHAKTIVGATEHIFALADELLDRSVQSSETRGLHEDKVRLLALVQDAIAATAATLGPSRRHWRIAPELDSVAELDSVTVTVDRRAMALVLLRVLSNAARFTSHGDWIDIGCARHDGDVVLSIADEGAGHPSGLGPTSPSTCVPNRRGMGLGLTVARQLMRAHGGELTVETAPRVGTRVTLTLPAGRIAA